MRQTIKERAGLTDTLRIFEGLHLSGGFIDNLTNGAKINRELLMESNKHLALCKKCRERLEDASKEPKDQDPLP